MDYSLPNRLMNDLLAEIDRSIVRSKLDTAEKAARRMEDDLKTANNTNCPAAEMQEGHLNDNTEVIQKSRQQIHFITQSLNQSNNNDIIHGEIGRSLKERAGDEQLYEQQRQRCRQLELDKNCLEQQLREKQEEVFKYTSKIQQIQLYQSSYRSMEKTLAELQKVHRESEEEIVRLREENEKLRERIRGLRVLVGSKLQFPVANLKQDFYKLKAQYKQREAQEERLKSEVQEGVKVLAKVVSNLQKIVGDVIRIDPKGLGIVYDGQMPHEVKQMKTIEDGMSSELKQVQLQLKQEQQLKGLQYGKRQMERAFCSISSAKGSELTVTRYHGIQNPRFAQTEGKIPVIKHDVDLARV